MDIPTARNILFWCTLINFGTLAFWGLLIVGPHEWLYRLNRRVYGLSSERFDSINLAGIVLYKVLIFFFNLVPYVALLIVG